MADIAPGKIPAWSQLLLAAILVALVGGAFWLKTRPNPSPVGIASLRLETTSVSLWGHGSA